MRSFVPSKFTIGVYVSVDGCWLLYVAWTGTVGPWDLGRISNCNSEGYWIDATFVLNPRLIIVIKTQSFC